MKRTFGIPVLLIGFCLSLCVFSFSRAKAEDGKRRAFLIGCDRFITMENTDPAAATNIRMLRDTLMTDSRGWDEIICRENCISSESRLAALIEENCGDSEENDLTLIYLATHSVKAPGLSGRAFLLSDGKTEGLLTAEELFDLLSGIKGKIWIIADSCNSGFLISKGMDDTPGGNLFSGDRFSILCSAGSDETSLYWVDGVDPFRRNGAGFFCTALCTGLGYGGGREADSNRDGRITLREIRDYVAASCGTSLCRSYPEDGSDRVLFEYDPSGEFEKERTISDVYFAGDSLLPGEDSVYFSYTLTVPAQVFYRTVYRTGSTWDFEHAVCFADSENDDLLSPGCKERSLSLERKETGENGYILVQIYSSASGAPVLEYSKVLSVLSEEDGVLYLPEEKAGSFSPARGEEMKIIASSSLPCLLTARVLDENRDTVCYLCSGLSTRPSGTGAEGAALIWNGKTSRGEAAPAGYYTVRVSAFFGQNTETSETAPFELMPAPAGDGTEDSPHPDHP